MLQAGLQAGLRLSEANRGLPQGRLLCGWCQHMSPLHPAETAEASPISKTAGIVFESEISSPSQTQKQA